MSCGSWGKNWSNCGRGQLSAGAQNGTSSAARAEAPAQEKPGTGAVGQAKKPDAAEQQRLRTELNDLLKQRSEQ